MLSLLQNTTNIAVVGRRIESSPIGGAMEPFGNRGYLSPPQLDLVTQAAQRAYSQAFHYPSPQSNPPVVGSFNQEEFSDRYQRNNKRGGLKNLRCFPVCSSEHRERGFCGTPVVVQVQRTSSQVVIPEIYCWAEFVRAGSESLKRGDCVSYSQSLAIERNKHDRTKPWIRGELVHERCTEDSIAFEFNRPRWGWHYGWTSNKHACNSKHCLRCYVFQPMSPGSDTLVLIASFESPHFVLYCRRRKRPGEEDGDEVVSSTEDNKKQGEIVSNTEDDNKHGEVVSSTERIKPGDGHNIDEASKQSENSKHYEVGGKIDECSKQGTQVSSACDKTGESNKPSESKDSNHTQNNATKTPRTSQGKDVTSAFSVKTEVPTNMSNFTQSKLNSSRRKRDAQPDKSVAPPQHLQNVKRLKREYHESYPIQNNSRPYIGRSIQDMYLANRLPLSSAVSSQLSRFGGMPEDIMQESPQFDRSHMFITRPSTQSSHGQQHHAFSTAYRTLQQQGHSKVRSIRGTEQRTKDLPNMTTSAVMRALTASSPPPYMSLNKVRRVMDPLSQHIESHQFDNHVRSNLETATGRVPASYSVAQASQSLQQQHTSPLHLSSTTTSASQSLSELDPKERIFYQREVADSPFLAHDREQYPARAFVPESPNQRHRGTLNLGSNFRAFDNNWSNYGQATVEPRLGLPNSIAQQQHSARESGRPIEPRNYVPSPFGTSLEPSEPKRSPPGT